MSLVLTMFTDYWEVYYHPSLVFGVDIGTDRTCGKWMYFFQADECDEVSAICREAVACDAVLEAKMSTRRQIEEHGYDTGVACFYIDGSSSDEHKRILSFMLSKELFPYRSNGCLEDTGFKFDWQTAAGLYDDDFVPEIMLSDYVDLSSGELL